MWIKLTGKPIGQSSNFYHILDIIFVKIIGKAVLRQHAVVGSPWMQDSMGCRMVGSGALGRAAITIAAVRVRRCGVDGSQLTKARS